MNVFYVDCEFNAHRGELISIAIIPQHGAPSLYAYCEDMYKADVPYLDPWVKNNVYNVLLKLPKNNVYNVLLKPPVCGTLRVQKVERHSIGLFGAEIRRYLSNVLLGNGSTQFIADSVVDIKYLCDALSTDANNDWQSVPGDMSFAVVDVESYPTELEGAIQHNAWWDARALKYQLMGEGK